MPDSDSDTRAAASDSPSRPALDDDAALATEISDAVRNTPGVVRLEPTLSTAGLRGLYRRGPTDGIQLVTRRGMVEVDINVATADSHQARAVAEDIDARVATLLYGLGCSQSSTSVNVLTVEATASP